MKPLSSAHRRLFCFAIIATEELPGPTLRCLQRRTQFRFAPLIADSGNFKLKRKPAAIKLALITVGHSSCVVGQKFESKCDFSSPIWSSNDQNFLCTHGKPAWHSPFNRNLQYKASVIKEFHGRIGNTRALG